MPLLLVAMPLSLVLNLSLLLLNDTGQFLLTELQIKFGRRLH